MVCVGELHRPHGVQGWVRASQFMGEAATFLALAQFYDETGQPTWQLQAGKETAKGLLLKLVGVDDRTAAEALTRQKLYIPREDLPEAAEDEVYLTDLVGQSVYCLQTGDVLGEIISTANYGAGDILVLKQANGREAMASVEHLVWDDTQRPCLDPEHLV